MLRNDREWLLAVSHCRGKNDRIVIMDITCTYQQTTPCSIGVSVRLGTKVLLMATMQ